MSAAVDAETVTADPPAQGPEGLGTHPEIADHIESDAADDADQADANGHDTNGKGAHNGKGPRSKKRAKTT